MIYKSIFDEIEIDVDLTDNIDESTIIKIKKRLKAKSLLDGEHNLGDLSKLADELIDKNVRANHIFVEKNIWLKRIIQGDYFESSTSKPSTNLENIDDLDSLREFLSPYLKSHIKQFLATSINRGSYKYLLGVLKQQALFSEEVKLIIISFLKIKLDFAAEYLNQGNLKNNEHPVNFITKKEFIQSLNQFPETFTTEVNELNSELTTLFNNNNKNTNSPLFLFGAKGMVALGYFDTSNVFLKDMFHSNARIARPFTLLRNKVRRKFSGYGGWGVIFLLFMLFKAIMTTSNSTDDFIRPGFNNYINSANDKNISFLKILNLMPRMNKNDKDIEVFDYSLYDNPYRGRFHTFHHPKTEEDISRFDTYVNNFTERDLIVFLLYKNNDKAVYIPKNQRAALQLGSKDTLLFYAGENFVSNKLTSKFFAEKSHLSYAYILDSINFDEVPTIEVLPEIEALNNNLDSSKVKSTKRDSIIFNNIKYKTIGLNSLPY